MLVMSLQMRIKELEDALEAEREARMRVSWNLLYFSSLTSHTQNNNSEQAL